MRKLTAFVLTLLFSLVLTTSPVTANHDPDKGLGNCGPLAGYQYSPTWGAAVTRTDLRKHQAAFRLKMNASQVYTLRCIANYVELDFEVRDSDLKGSWDGFTVKTDLPQGVKDTTFSDRDEDNPRPTVTNIHTNKLVPGRIYYATVTWLTPANRTPAVRLYWTPMHWANRGQLDRPSWEKIFCDYNRRDPRYCLFGFDDMAVRLHSCSFPDNTGGWLKLGVRREIVYKIDYDFRTPVCIDKGED
jgi:hypothetical protein